MQSAREHILTMIAAITIGVLVWVMTKNVDAEAIAVITTVLLIIATPMIRRGPQ